MFCNRNTIHTCPRCAKDVHAKPISKTKFYKYIIHSYRYLANGHCADDVEKDEGAVGEIVSQQAAVTDALNPRYGRERQLGYYVAVKSV
jgi:hypothetical protein